MSRWRLAEVVAATAGTPLSSFESRHDFEGISTDTRELKPGQLFVPLVGENFDGHDYLDQALQAGAAAALCSRPEARSELPLIRVEDTLEAYQQLGRFHRQRLDIPVLAVTGSTGKTTTKELLATLLGSRYRVHKTHANFNNDIGVPKTLLELTEEHEVAVLELAMRASGEIRRLARLLAARVGVITNIGTSHIEFLGSQEAIADAKAELFECLPCTAKAVLPQKSPFFERLASRTRASIRPFAIPESGVENLGLRGWNLSWRGEILHLPLPGRHHLEDLMAALVAVEDFGLDPVAMAATLADFRLTDLRMQITRLDDGTTVLNDAYNAAPDSMTGALEVLCQGQGRKVAVLGDMLELGSEERRGHADVGRACARLGVDVVLAVGQRSRHLAEAAKAAGVPSVSWVADRVEAAGVLAELVQPADVILFKASRGMRLEVLAEQLEASALEATA